MRDFYDYGGKYLTVYHGSNVIVDRPKIFKKYRPMDFGGGFYTTTNFYQAEKFAMSVSKNRDKSKKLPVINIYKLNIKDLKLLCEVSIFKQADFKWLDFVAFNRHENKKIPGLDAVFGPVADDQAGESIERFYMGIYKKDWLLKMLDRFKSYDQIVFKSRASLEFLEFENSIVFRKDGIPMNSDEFLIYSIENYKYEKDLPGEDVYNLFMETGVYKNLLRYYETLEQSGSKYTVEMIDKWLNKGLDFLEWC